MCIIAIKPAQAAMFDESIIRTMFSRNPDGAGYMFVEDGKVRIEKGFMDVGSLIESLREKDFDGKNLILHFRIGTSGLRDGLNTHPYPVFETNGISCKADIAMAHNGILHDFTPRIGSKINDTQCFIHEVLEHLDKDFLKDEGKMFLISKLIGTNRLAFLNEKDEVVTLGDFISDQGYLFSNSSYKGIKPVVTGYKPSYYQPVTLFDEDEEDKLEHKLLSFDSDREMMNFINSVPNIWMMDEDLYEDLDGNFYEVDHESLMIFKN